MMGAIFADYSRVVILERVGHLVPIIVPLVALLIMLVALYEMRKQTDLLKRQVFGELYDEAQLRNMEFFLPEKRKRPVRGFRDKQSKDKEVSMGEEINIPISTPVELFVRWWMTKNQHPKIVSFGFLDKYKEEKYENHPEIIKMEERFERVIEGITLGRLTKNWYGHLTREYTTQRFIPANECMVAGAFVVKGSKRGKYPFEVGVTVEEAPHPHKEVLWVRVS